MKKKSLNANSDQTSIKGEYMFTHVYLSAALLFNVTSTEVERKLETIDYYSIVGLILYYQSAITKDKTV